MDRAAAHAALDALLDHLERARTANSPEAHVAAEAEAHEAWQRLAAGVAGPMIARRLGAAWHGRRPDDPDRFQPAAEIAARTPLRATELHDSEIAVATRQVLARFLLDHGPLLPPNMATHAAAALLMLNLGEKGGWLVTPFRVQGMSAASGREAMGALAALTHIYYLAGFDGCSVEKAAEKALADSVADFDRAWARLTERRKRHGWAERLGAYRAAGEADRAAGRPFSPPIGPRYSLREMEDLPKL